ncbi:hypothetical protein [Arcobacter sp. FWKO B]|uniref:hypothetical protein n=1 Tax=Arcobacter sp. FWKO B TaxID=2593672 RepID=UPI0018A4F656|nr:hypothetical protein [Arcobacter sp. FWKO B]QOG12026.1 hypothetical protein FWKOB_04600 [Arcobacter sp. FWKO B]
MSMSQEEIEALMNGIELDDDQESSQGSVEQEDVSIASDDTPLSQDDIASLVDNTTENEVASGETPTEDDSASMSDDDIEAMLASIGGVTDTPAPASIPEPKKEESTKTSAPSAKNSDDEIEKIASSWASKKVEEGVFPYPVTKDHKPINQLSEVANDSEEKASKIFDVLSFILDENNVIQQENKKLDQFLDKQITLMDALSKKFPNIGVFNANYESALALKDSVKIINSRVDAENMQLFEAMELMQFHDINRQKIERVMAVIRKLSGYLNNLFEDDGSHKEVAVAKHIHGDNNSDLVGGDDLEALIAEFNKN